MTIWDPILSSKSDLRKDLLQNYTKELPPNDTLTTVYISFSAFDTNNIIDFDDKDGKFIVSGYLEVSWIDPRIAMNWASSSAIQNKFVSLYFKDSEVWTPQIRQINAYFRSDLEKVVEETVLFDRNGSALMVKMDIFTTECKTDYYFFPFDTQKCAIDIVIWGSFMGETVLKARNSIINKKLYKETYIWNLQDARMSVDSIKGACFQVIVIIQHRYYNKKRLSKEQFCEVVKESEIPSPDYDKGEEEKDASFWK
ncbi:neuronal acetylcholine receptor subunit alpha-7-like [Saccostrea cucullata]|uniref:neuronal acetylcholine receptor subunit alpha-7-like n=1 Tax=Saccostrea cuccullata TaxID=36930 RepID=UPI002ED12E50